MRPSHLFETLRDMLCCLFFTIVPAVPRIKAVSNSWSGCSEVVGLKINKVSILCSLRLKKLKTEKKKKLLKKKHLKQKTPRKSYSKIKIVAKSE